MARWFGIRRTGVCRCRNGLARRCRLRPERDGARRINGAARCELTARSAEALASLSEGLRPLAGSVRRRRIERGPKATPTSKYVQQVVWFPLGAAQECAAERDRDC